VFCFIGFLGEPAAISGTGGPLLIGVATLAFLRVRRFTLLVKLLIWDSGFCVIIAVCVLIWQDTGAVIVLWKVSSTLKRLMIISIASNALNAFLASVLLGSAERTRYGLKYFSPLQFKTIMALAEVVIYGERKVISSEEVAHNVDTYFKSFEAKSKWTMLW
jgi:hypothetical protein